VNGGAELPALVAAEIVDDDHIVFAETRNERLLDVGKEALAVDRTVGDDRGDEAVGAQRRHKGAGTRAASRLPLAHQPRSGATHVANDI
jgi:hypothetical protein